MRSRRRYLPRRRRYSASSKERTLVSTSCSPSRDSSKNWRVLLQHHFSHCHDLQFDVICLLQFYYTPSCFQKQKTAAPPRSPSRICLFAHWSLLILTIPSLPLFLSPCHPCSLSRQNKSGDTPCRRAGPIIRRGSISASRSRNCDLQDACGVVNQCAKIPQETETQQSLDRERIILGTRHIHHHFGRLSRTLHILHEFSRKVVVVRHYNEFRIKRMAGRERNSFVSQFAVVL